MTNSRWKSMFSAALLIAVAGCGSSSHSATEPPTGGTSSGGEASSGGGTTDVAEATPQGDVAQVGAGEDADESMADLAEHHRHHHHGGFAMFIAMSLNSLNTTPEQAAAITKIRTDMHAAMAPAHDAERAVLLALAEGMASNEIDQSRVDAAIAELKTASARVDYTVAGSLGALHATLTPPQRAALADKVEAHFEVWHHTNAPDEAAMRDAHGGHLGKLAKELALSPQQVETIRARFTSSMSGVPHFDRAEADARLKAFGVAFAGDTFAPKALFTGSPNAHMAAWGITRTVHFYEAVLPVLTPEQRAKLAGDVRRHANYQHNEMPS
jgi:Spy/CpxP family protein refolding chaperone